MISLIAAIDQNRGIGKNNQLPWRLPADLRRFRELTIGKDVIMGRKTFESIGRPLDGRRNWVLSQTLKECEGATIVQDPSNLIRRFLDTSTECFVIGGEEVYSFFLPYASRLYLTLVDGTFDTDRHFPKIPSVFKLLKSKQGIVDSANPYPHKFLIYDRKESLS